MRAEHTLDATLQQITDSAVRSLAPTEQLVNGSDQLQERLQGTCRTRCAATQDRAV
ncbi:hypothetical protein ACH4CD_00060 [Streptomyces fungicidicus]|uniref:hypothetical protein n=1 Tax=Streptomyces fungicidicus TaxID=68203 RepID=UPI00379FCC7B